MCVKRCVICENVIEVEAISGWADGYNAYPIAEGRCCKRCDDSVVIAERMRRAFKRMRVSIKE